MAFDQTIVTLPSKEKGPIELTVGFGWTQLGDGQRVITDRAARCLVLRPRGIHGNPDKPVIVKYGEEGYDAVLALARTSEEHLTFFADMAEEQKADRANRKTIATLKELVAESD